MWAAGLTCFALTDTVTQGLCSAIYPQAKKILPHLRAHSKFSLSNPCHSFSFNIWPPPKKKPVFLLCSLSLSEPADSTTPMIRIRAFRRHGWSISRVSVGSDLRLFYTTQDSNFIASAEVWLKTKRDQLFPSLHIMFNPSQRYVSH